MAPLTSIKEHLSTARNARNILADDEFISKVEAAARLAIETLQYGRKILLVGNGGSAADAQHISAELVGKFRRPRRPISAIALTVDTSFLTAWANDFDYETVYARQVEALGNEGDLLWSLSTSGNSPSVVHAMRVARDRGLKNLLFSGQSGGEAGNLAHVAVLVPLTDTAHIQELHVVGYHAICAALDELAAST